MTLVIHLAFGVGCKPGEPNIPVTLLHNVHMVPLALVQRTVAKVREACGGEQWTCASCNTKCVLVSQRFCSRTISLFSVRGERETIRQVVGDKGLPELGLRELEGVIKLILPPS